MISSLIAGLEMKHLIAPVCLLGGLAACSGSGYGDEPAYADGPPDAMVPGTDYNATTEIPCGFGGAAPRQRCPAGVKRNWDGDGKHLVEITKPDGLKRAIYFSGTMPYGSDSAEADGSAGWTFNSTRSGDRVTINFGPETYVIADAFVEGG
jgi:hypothetical protein